MGGIDLTVAVTAHSETLVAGPAMASASAAIRAAEAEGLRVERLIALDLPSENCRAFFTQPDFGTWKIAEFETTDLGLLKNAVAEIATGRWITFLDADDLFSENWLTLGAERLAQADDAQDGVIVHPELNWHFDEFASVLAALEQDDPLFAPGFFYFANYYDAVSMAPRALHLQVPFAPDDKAGGLSGRDWQWNIETMAGGWRHVTARDTIVFKRRREASLDARSGESQAVVRQVEPVAIDRISALRSGHSEVERPS